METQAKGYQRTEAACLKRGYALATIFQSPAIWAPCRRHRFLCCIQGTRAQRCIFSSSAMVFGGYVGEEQFQGWVTTYDWPQPSQSDHLGSSTAYSMPAKVPQRCSQLSFRHSRMELRPPTARKSHPNFFAHCKRSTQHEKVPKIYHPKCAKHHENARHPHCFKLWKIINNMICFNIKTPCKRMIHVCLGKKYIFLAKLKRI